MTEFDAIIRVASLWLAQKSDDEIRIALPQIDESSVPLVLMAAAKLMEGKYSGVHTDDPITIQRCRAACPAHWGLRRDDRRSIWPHKKFFCSRRDSSGVGCYDCPC